MSDLLRDRDEAEDAGEFDSWRDDRWDAAHGYSGHGPVPVPDDVLDPVLAALARTVSKMRGHIGTPGGEPPC